MPRNRLWFAGIAKGPQAVEHELADILAPDVLIKADKVKHFKDTEVGGQVCAHKTPGTRAPSAAHALP